jgi:Zinc finger C-x8-C-x5-C-x3-H type (and similar)
MAPCRFYLQGRCDRGSRCSFDHQQPGNEGRSTLRAGANPFIPNSDSFTNTGKSPSILFAEPCRFFLKGSCAKGASCSYRHVVSAAALSEQKQTSEETVAGQPDPFSTSRSQPNLTTDVTVLQKPVAEGSTARGSITNPVCLLIPFLYRPRD